jgi:hypothetical protein
MNEWQLKSMEGSTFGLEFGKVCLTSAAHPSCERFELMWAPIMTLVFLPSISSFRSQSQTLPSIFPCNNGLLDIEPAWADELGGHSSRLLGSLKPWV